MERSFWGGLRLLSVRLVVEVVEGFGRLRREGDGSERGGGSDRRGWGGNRRDDDAEVQAAEGE